MSRPYFSLYISFSLIAERMVFGFECSDLNLLKYYEKTPFQDDLKRCYFSFQEKNSIYAGLLVSFSLKGS